MVQSFDGTGAFVENEPSVIVVGNGISVQWKNADPDSAGSGTEVARLGKVA